MYTCTVVHISVWWTNVMQGLKTHHFSLSRYWTRGPNRREGFSSFQFFIFSWCLWICYKL